MARHDSRGDHYDKRVTPTAGSRCGARRLMALLAALLGATTAQAQTIRVVLRDSVTNAPIIGALVAAADSNEARRVDGLSNDQGVVTLRLAAAGTWNLDVRRIGVQPRRLPGIAVGDGATVTLTLPLSSIRTQLSQVRVTADAGVCGRAPSGDGRAAALWEQISLALRSSTLGRSETLYGSPLQFTERVRELGEKLEEVSSRVVRTGYGAGRPFSAASPSLLAERGYITRESDGSLQYYAPDEIVLLSDEFLATHCFSTPKRDEDPTQAELTFKPVRGRKVADVEGTAFVDTVSGELRRIDFRYAASRTLIPGNARFAGGDVALARQQNGRWYVSRWAIRMPVFALVGLTQQVVLRGYREVGGTVDPVVPVSRPD